MVDRDLIFAKAGRIQHHLLRIEAKRGDLKTFLSDTDRQDIVAFNFQSAIQNCIDVAAHVIASEGMGVPGSIGDMFYILEERGLLTHRVTEKIVRAVGFRNLLVHEYGKIDLKRVHRYSEENLKDILEYLNELLQALGLAS
jgi:uncharacterized protein YutE (UPF0331/DUF86 family)